MFFILSKTELITPIKTNDKNLKVGPVEAKNLMLTR